MTLHKMNHPKPFRSLLTVLVLVLGSLSGHAQAVGWKLPSSAVDEGGSIYIELERNSAVVRDTAFITIFSDATDPIASFSDTVVFSEEALIASCSVVASEDILCETASRDVIFRIDRTSRTFISTDSTHTLTIQDNDMAQANITGTDSLVCGSDTVQLVADSLLLGWSGTWTVVAPGAGEFADSTQPSTSFVASSFGLITLRWIIENNECMDTANVIVNVVQPRIAEVGSDQTICSNGTTGPLGGTLPNGWSGVWSSENDMGTFSDPDSSSSTFNYDGTLSSILLTWEITDDLQTCPLSSSTVEISVVQPPVSSITPNSYALCQADPYTLHGNVVGTDQAGAWSISGGGSVTWFSDMADPSSLFTPASSGSFQLTWTVSDLTENCQLASATLDLEVFTRPFAGDDSTLWLCGDGGSVDLFGLLGSGVDTGGVWSTNTDTLPNGVYEPNTMEPSTYYYVVSGNTLCPTDSAEVLVREVEPPTAPSVSSLEGDVFCSGQYTSLAVVDPLPGVEYEWTCQGCTNDTLIGETVELHWGDNAAPWSYSVSAQIGQCNSQSVFNVGVGDGVASCPKGIVFFEPHGLAVLDHFADQFQWGSITEIGAFVPMVGATQQTIFDPAHINGCLPYYAVRTRSGNGCWTTTTKCMDDIIDDRICSNSGMILDPEEIEVGVSPNPAHDGFIRVLLSGVTAYEPITVELYHANGQLAYRQGYLATSQLVIDPGTLVLPSGLYLLRVNGTDWVKTAKLSIN